MLCSVLNLCHGRKCPFIIERVSYQQQGYYNKTSYIVASMDIKSIVLIEVFIGHILSGIELQLILHKS